MPHQIGYVEAGGGKLAHQVMLETIADFCADNGWEVLRFDDTLENHELILKAPGLSGEEEIFVAMNCYQNANADYYNLCAAAMLGYVPGNALSAQPGCVMSGIPAHNLRIDYWLSINGQRLVGALKVGTPVYESFYLGKFLPYAPPSQYPYPVICAGMLNGTPATRYSDSAHSMPFKGARANLLMRFNDGTWRQPQTWPWVNENLVGGTRHQRDTGGVYTLNRIELTDASNIYGVLDGVCHITGFNNVTENLANVDGEAWVVMQDTWRTGFSDYVAIRMDP